MPDVSSAVAAARRAAESRMTSTCTIRRESAPGSRDAAGFRTGFTVVYSGPCELTGGGVRKVTIGGTESEQATRTLKLPALTTGPKDADLAVIDSGDAAGVALRLLEVTPADHKKALAISCVEA